ncbi:MAG: hypothetical protein QM770_12860 [Tepidisphaeraceae bacterium]
MPQTMSSIPDPLVMNDGTRVTSVEQWRAKRRPEIVTLLTREMYGVSPAPTKLATEIFDEDRNALGGKATRRQVAFYWTGDKAGPRMDLLIYLPSDAKEPVPVIFGLNFWGNHAVTADPGVRLTTNYVEAKPNGFVDPSGLQQHHATDASRGIDAKRWSIEQMLARGYGFATAYRGDIDPDLAKPADLPDGFFPGIKSLFPELQNRDDNFGTVAAWAWACSRVMDYLQTDRDVDAQRVALFGWSRLGKAAIWAAANDERFALLISSEAGAGGATLFHHNVGENIQRLTTIFPHWYARNFAKYAGRETTMPFDQHFALALVAPRPVYVASSEGSTIFDPIGEFQGLKYAEPVWILCGKTGIPADDLPPLDQPSIGYLAYHRRTGKHDVLPFDWQHYLDFCDRHLKAPNVDR